MHSTNLFQRFPSLSWLVLAVSLLFSGCQMTAPMHVWKAPRVPKPGVVKIAVAPIAGNTEVSERVQNAMQLAQPQPNPMVVALHPNELAKAGGIQLVSYDNQPSDMATLAAARQAGMDYLLQGSIVESKLDTPPPEPNDGRFRIFKRKPKEPNQSLSVHWTIIDVPSGQRIQEQTVSIDRKEAEKKYPDLALHTPTGDGKVLMASARESWALIAPTTQQDQAMLDLPWFSRGSSQVRKGNGYAKQGRWDLAENEWQQVAEQHPRNTAAWTNLSLAATAREDFQLARDRLKHANTFLPGDSTFPTLTWIEQRQRHYHQVMNMPTPTGGWTLPDPPKQVRPEEVPSSPPREIKDMPWWTAVPFIPPPGWTWKQWWTQPIVL